MQVFSARDRSVYRAAALPDLLHSLQCGISVGKHIALRILPIRKSHTHAQGDRRKIILPFAQRLIDPLNLLQHQFLHGAVHTGHDSYEFIVLQAADVVRRAEAVEQHVRGPPDNLIRARFSFLGEYFPVVVHRGDNDCDVIVIRVVEQDVKSAVDVIAAGHTGFQDVVRVEVLDPSDYASAPLSVSYMANVGGVGLDARVCEIVNRKKEQGRRGKKLYVSALLYCIKHRVPIRAKVVCDGKEVFAGRYLSIAFGVGRYSGGGMRQTPLAELGDGLLDITVIPDIPIWTIAKEVPRLFTGTFHKVDVLTMAKCREVLVLPDGEADAEPAEVDGEVVGRAPVRMTVLDEQIRVVMPDLH